MSTVYTNTSDMSFSSSFPDGPTGEQQKDLAIFFDAFHGGPFGYLFVNEDALAVHFNDKVCELLCIDPLLFRNKSIYDFLLDEEHNRIRDLLESCTQSFAEPVRMVKVKCKKNRFRFVTIYMKRLASQLDSGGLYIMLFLKNDFNPLSASKEENEAFYRAIIETQEAEREFIGKSLHESIAQELYAIRINLQRYMMEHGHEQQIMPIKKMLNDTIFKVQNISNDLVPTVLRDMGFQKAIDDMVFRMTRSDVRFLLKLDKEINSEGKEIQFCAYRVIQELFNNCLKHTDAKRISLKVGVTNDFIGITVEDNGQGFSRDMESALQLGTGLRNIRNRIALYAGTMDMVSSSKGSKMQIKLYK